MKSTTTRNVGRHHRHLLELSSLLATAGLADAFADVFGARRHGSSALIGLGVALIVGTVGHHVCLRRSDHAPPPAPISPASADVPVAGFTAGAVTDAAPVVGDVAGVANVADVAGAPTSGVFWRLRTRIDNTPGRLAVLAGALAAAGANIHALEAHPAPAGVIDEFLVETSRAATAEQLCAAVRAVGGSETTAVPADVLALLDAPTRALELAARLARSPASLDAALRDLLDARDVSVAASAGPGAPGAWIEGADLVLRRADGVTFTASRPGIAFTATELSRARALVELARHLHPAPEACARPR